MSPVKRDVPSEVTTPKGRMQLLRQLFATPPVNSLTYKEIATVLGVTEDAAKRWADRGIALEKELVIIAAAEARGIQGVTVRWLRTGQGPRPSRSDAAAPGAPAGEGSAIEGRPVGAGPTRGGTADALPSSDVALEGTMVGETVKLLRELAHHDDVKISNGGRTWLATQLSQLALTYSAAQQLDAARALLSLADDVRKATGG